MQSLTFILMKYLLICMLAIGLAACNQQPETVKTDTPLPATNPPDSELTLYMRHLEKQAQTWRTNVLEGKNVEWNELLIDSMFTAVPTDGKIGNSLLFEKLGIAFKTKVQGLSLANSTDLSSHYNLMITACVNCHRNFCPGPIKRIEKLRIN